MAEVEVLAQGTDVLGPWRRVRLPDGSEKLQRPVITVEREIVRKDGTVERGEITDITVEEAP